MQTMARAAIALVAIVLVALPLLPQAQENAPPYTLLSRDGRRPIPIVSTGGRELIALDDIAGLFQVAVRTDALAGGVTLTYRGKTIIASADRPMASVDGRVVALPSPLVQAGRRWLAPVEFLPRALGPIYDQRITLRPAARLVIVGDLRVPRLSARIESAGPPTRAVVAISPAGRVVATTDNNRILLRVDADALETAFPPSATGLIESIRLGDQPDTVVVSLTRGAGAPRIVVTTADEGTRVIIDVPQAAPTEAARGPAPDTRPPAPDVRPPGADASPAALTIVIDAGHGGDDVGVRGAAGLQEKQLTLDVARRVRAILESRLGLRVILTREDDKTVTLDERAAAANNNKANLLVSLHANGAPSGTPAGAEVFYDRLDREGEAVRRLIDTQSTALPVIGGGTRPIEIVPWDLAQARHIESSEVLAGVVEEELRKVVPMSTRPKQQAPMRLLSAANMPAVLVEMAYLTNSGQEKQAGTDPFKNGVAQAIVNAIARFRSLTDDREAP